MVQPPVGGSTVEDVLLFGSRLIIFLSVLELLARPVVPSAVRSPTSWCSCHQFST